MKIIRAANCRTSPWKNGGGSTTEIAVGPIDASLDNFDWRVSMARVASDGPFSEFPGIDRTLAIINGNGLALTIGHRTAFTIDRGSAPANFPGDVPTSARLIAGEILDLNVMSRRGRFSHRLRRVRKPTSLDFAECDIAIAIACEGTAVLKSQNQSVALDRGDAVIIGHASDEPFELVPTALSDCYLVELREHSDQPG